MNFQQKLDQTVERNNSLVCVGLDSNFEKLPEVFKTMENPQFDFNKEIIDATANLICAYKPNSAFYEARGEKGIKDLKMTCDYLHSHYPDIPIILDAKRGDIGSTNDGYVNFAYDYLGVDAITLNPYLGRNALIPFLNRSDKGAIILCLTSNPGSEEFQKQPISPTASSFLSNPELHSAVTNDPLYIAVAKVVVKEWNENDNCLLVVGATHPEELAKIREIAGDMTFLIPGIGAQGGDVEKTVKAGINSKKSGMIINSSRGIIFASNGSDFAQKAKEETEKLKNQINQFR